MSKATCRIRQVERSTFDMSPVAVLRVDGSGCKSPVFGDKSKELNVFNYFDKSNVPATCRTSVSSIADDTLTTCHLRLVVFDMSSVAFLRTPFPQIDIIGAMVIVWRVRGKIIRSVLCNSVQQLCTVQCTHI